MSSTWLLRVEKRERGRGREVRIEEEGGGREDEKGEKMGKRRKGENKPAHFTHIYFLR